MTSNQEDALNSTGFVVHPATRLRQLLDAPAPKLEEWQDEAGRMSSLLAVRFPQESDEATALRSVGLIGLATVLGVKEAKKKSLKLTRWSTSPPLPLNTLSHLDEQHAAVAALSKLNAPWSVQYVDKELSDASLAAELMPDLLKWARISSQNWATFVTDTYAGTIRNCADSVRLSALLKEAPKLLRTFDTLPADQMAETLSSILRAIVAAASSLKDDEKSSVALLHSGYLLYEQAWKCRPALLFQPVLLNALAQLTAEMKNLRKQLPGNVDEAMLATLSLVSDSILRFGVTAVRQYRPIVPLWAAAYPAALEQISLAAASEPSLNGLLNEEVEHKVEGDQGYLAEAAFASLLPAWDAFVNGLADPDQAASLNLMLNRAAGTVSVERQGTVGEVISFDPLSHHLAVPSDRPPLKVKVLRTGVIARRSDGSQRTLVQTLVAAA